MREHTRKYEKRQDKIEQPKPPRAYDPDYEKKASKYTIDEIQKHPFWREDFSIKVCKTMDYLMCETAMKCLKEAEKQKTIYDSPQDVNCLLIENMNASFGKDVFKLNVTTESKYLKIKC